MGYKVTITKKMYGWSKYGGSRDNIRKEQLPIWYCQACGEEQVKILPQYMISEDEENVDYVRVCAVCKHKAVTNYLLEIDGLIALVRAPTQIVQLANLATIAIRY